jgi:prevent-host-death family protein
MGAEIGAFEAKTQLSRLLRAVAKGEQFTITVRGRPVADLVPWSGHAAASSAHAVAAMAELEKVHGVEAATLAEWIEAGRR